MITFYLVHRAGRTIEKMLRKHLKKVNNYNINF